MSSFPCPVCGEKTGVKDTRVDLRKRKCFSCEKVFYTQEIEFVPNWTTDPFYLRRLELYGPRRGRRPIRESHSVS